jgi:hypothetical protein
MARLVSPLAVAAALAIGLWAGALAAADEPERRQMTEAEIDTWLQADPTDQSKDTVDADDQEEAPPPPPRDHGFVVESTVGAMGHIGPLKNVSPTSPWFHLHFGFEPFSFLMLFAEGDLVFSTTSYANRPPDPRAYALFGFGGGLRLTVKPVDRFGIYVQGSAGGAKITEDVLFHYGYQNAEQLGLYWGGQLGLEWYQVNPHLALALTGGVKNYQDVLGRDRGGGQALAWVGGLSLRYVF